MAKVLPDLFLHVGGTHVHHLNYGIFALSVVAAWLLFWPPRHQRTRRRLAVLYGIGMALTFDEFGMWLHLGGGYWQRSSFDAVVVIAGALALLACGSSLRKLHKQSVAAIAIAVSLAACFAYVYRDYVALLESEEGQRLRQLELHAPQ